MEDKNLQDIKIDDIESSKKTPLKNILTLLALLFIILVISVVITKLILNTDDGHEIDGNVTTTEASAQTEEGTDGKGNLLTTAGAAIAGAGAAVVAGTQNAAASAKDAVVDTASATKDGVKNAAGNAASAVKEGAKNAASAVTLKERNVSGSKTKVTLRDHQPTKAVKELVAPKSTSTKKDSSSTKKATPTKKSTPSKSSTSSKKSTANTSDKVIAKKSTTGSIGTTVSKLANGFYIKVGTFKNTETAIKKVKKTGLNYKLVKTKDGKLTRVYIGKFNSKKSAQANLSKAKNVNEGAFIYEEK